MAKKVSTPLPDRPADLLVELGQIDELLGNPNVMDVVQVQILQNSILEFGFCQPVTLVAQPQASGRYWLVDGAHRLLGARNLGLVVVPACLMQTPLGQEEQFVRAARLALNRIRGLVDLSAASQELTQLLDLGWARDGLLVCGFSEGELAALLQPAALPLEGMGEQLGEGAPMSEPADKPRRFNLNLQFTDREDRDWVRSRLTQAGPTCEVGILEILRNGTKEN